MSRCGCGSASTLPIVVTISEARAPYWSGCRATSLRFADVIDLGDIYLT